MKRSTQWQAGLAKTITFIVTKDCQLACKYCYLVGKNSNERMTWNVAKKAIDYILDCEIIEKFDENLIVKTVTNQDEAINKIKLVDEKLYVSKDNGETWIGGIDIVPDPPTDTTKVVVVNGVMYKSEDGVNWTSEVTEEDASDTEDAVENLTV